MSKRVQSSMRDEDYEYIAERAQKRGVSIGTLIRWVLGGWVSKRREEDARGQVGQSDGEKEYGP